tara:strand:+ start:635 stop:874 length:240 start_codon:yes stop_codon:yes gene_type:complete
MRKEYSQAKVDKIYNFTSISTKDKIDRLLEIDACQYTNLGKDSTDIEKETVKKNSRYIYKTIKKIDNALGNNFLQHQDK